MMQNSTPLTPLNPDLDLEDEVAIPDQTTVDRMAAIWVSRITSVVGLVCLGLALIVWHFRPEHYRSVLALLTVAMFAAILRSYTFENGT